MAAKLSNSSLATLRAVCLRHGVARAALFGSCARGDAREDSDVDLLVEFRSEGKSLVDLVALKQDLEDQLRRRVDVVTYRSLHRLLRETVLKEQVPVL